MFYYSGHGFQLDSGNYLAPVEFDAANEAQARQQAVSFDSIKSRLERSPAGLSIMTLDSCRDNPFQGSWSPARGMALMEAGLGSYIVFAASPGKTASDNPRERNGLFTKHLIQELKTPGSVPEIFRRVRRKVADDSNGGQLPYLHDQLIGDFSFMVGSSVAQDSPTVSPDFDKAKQLYHEGKCEEAANLFDRLVRTQPTNAFAQNALGLAYLCLSMKAPAVKRFSLAIELKPDYGAAYLNRGYAFLKNAQYELAIQDFDWAIEQEPENGEFHDRRGQARFGLRQYEAAQADFAEAIRLDAFDAHAYQGIGRVFLQLGKFKEALQHLTHAIALRHDFGQAYLDRASARDRLNDPGGATADRAKAREYGIR